MATLLKTKGSAATPSTEECAFSVNPKASIMSKPGMAEEGGVFKKTDQVIMDDNEAVVGGVD